MRDTHDRPDPIVAIGRDDEGFDLRAYREFVRLADAGSGVALVTVIGEKGSSPRGMGAAMAVRADGASVGTIGGGSLEVLMIRHALDAIADGRPRRVLYDYSGGRQQNLEKACMGKTEFLVQPAPKPARLYIFGAGHIAAALAPMAEAAGFRVAVLDDRAGYPRPADFPASARLLPGPFAEAIGRMEFDSQRTYGVIVTYGHSQDEIALRACLLRPWRYMGLIGSQAKIARVFRDLAVDAASREALERIHAPIGLDLGGRAPGEIAVGIVAELVAVRNGREQIGFLRESRRVRLGPRAEAETAPLELVPQAG